MTISHAARLAALLSIGAAPAACGRTFLEPPVASQPALDAGAADGGEDRAAHLGGDASPGGTSPGDASIEHAGDAPTDMLAERRDDGPADTALEARPETDGATGPCSTCRSGTSCVRGSFSIQQVLPTGMMPDGLAAGDFDRDGFLDLVVANKNSPQQQVFFGSASGTFGRMRSLAADEPQIAVATADFDGDGWLDLAFSVNFYLTIWSGDGAGGFRQTPKYLTGVFPVWIEVGDFNRDGALDLALAEYNLGNVIVFTGDGRGAFQQGSPFHVGDSPIFIAAADLDEDTMLDLVVVEYGDDAISVHHGHGDGTFAAGSVHGVLDAPDLAAVADFDDDGHLDVAVSDEGGGAVSVFRGDGRGGLGAPLNVPAGLGVGSVATIDANADGILDLVVRNISSVIGTGNGSISFLQGDGRGGFRQVQNMHTGSEPQSFVARDFNGDGHADLAFVDYLDDTLTILLWNDGYACR
ncbi:MAG TPA: VCBS repeat-containing protein [Polyangia bacterium]|jgi:hypothetical protein